MPRTTDRVLRLLGLLLGLLLLPGWTCGTSLTKNPGFDLWCGDELCAWKVEAGSIRRIPTWHRSDFGVELLGEETVLSQLVHTSVTCFFVELQVQREEGASPQGWPAPQGRSSSQPAQAFADGVEGLLQDRVAAQRPLSHSPSFSQPAPSGRER